MGFAAQSGQYRSRRQGGTGFAVQLKPAGCPMRGSRQALLPLFGDVKTRCLRQRAISATITAATERKEAVLYAQRKHKSDQKSKGPFPAGACRQAEHCAANSFKMGARSFPKLKILYPNPRLRYFQNTLLCGYSESSASSWLPLDKESVSSICIATGRCFHTPAGC